MPGVAEKNGRPVRARTADLHRFNFEVRRLKPFASLAFPVLTSPQKAPKCPSFGDELVTSFCSYVCYILELEFGAPRTSIRCTTERF